MASNQGAAIDLGIRQKMRVIGLSSLKQRWLLGTGLLFAVCLLFVKSSFFHHLLTYAIGQLEKDNVTGMKLRNRMSSHSLSLQQTVYQRRQGNPANLLNSKSFQSIAHHIRHGHPDNVLNSRTYRTKKTSFEDSFPPNTGRASTLFTEFTIGNFGLCNDTDHIDFLVVVHTAVTHLDRRQTIRFSWARRNLIQGASSRTIFLLGQTNDASFNEVLLLENRSYGDLVQGDFLDSYDNLTLKHVMGLRWVSNYCSNAKRVIKVDDDVFVDIFRARELYFSHLDRSPKQIICEVGTRNIVFRKSKNQDYKWAVSDDYFKGLTLYPMPFCFGFAVFMSIDLAKALYQSALNTPAYPLDDVYVYGILTSTVSGAVWRDEEKVFSKDERETLSNWGCGRHRPFILGTFKSKGRAQMLWNTTLECLKKL